DIVEGTSLNIPGLTGQVLNVIRKSSGISGQFDYGARFRTDDVAYQWGQFDLSVSGGNDALNWTVGLENGQFRGGEEGLELVTDAAGRVIDRRDEAQLFYGDEPQLSGSLRWYRDGGDILNVNGQIGGNLFRGRETSLRQAPDAPARLRRFRNRENEFNYELGGDYEFALGPGRLKLIALRSYEDSPTLTRVDVDFNVETGEDRPLEGSRFSRDADEAETIARAEYGFTRGDADWQVSLEGALNSLAIDSAFAERETNGDLQNIPFPGATAKVEEKRGEISLSYGRPLAPDLTLQSSLGGEYSTITQSGPAGKTRSFIRPKGFIALAWAAATGLDISARLEREVGQLNFFDFIASVNLNNDTVNVSNADLVPSQSWNSEIEVTQSLGSYGSVTARGYYQAISDIVDQVPIGLTGEAPGNLDSARRYGIEWNSTFLGDPIGWTGAKLDIELQLQRSRLDDPLTGEPRSISFGLLRDLEVDFRYDIPTSDWAVGAFWENRKEAAQVRLDSIFEQYESPGFIQVFAEHKDIFGLTVRGA
ncbi:MAG: TonB-dependent receptor, partial [Pacificimonas sp.]